MPIYFYLSRAVAQHVCVCVCVYSFCSVLHARLSMRPVFSSLGQSPSITRALIQSRPLSQSEEGWPSLLASHRATGNDGLQTSEPKGKRGRQKGETR